MNHSQPKPRRKLSRKAVAGALQSHTRGLVSSSALTAVPDGSRLPTTRAGSSLVATLLWALLTASTLVAPILLAPTSHARAEDLEGTKGSAGSDGAIGGSGNGWGGSNATANGGASHNGGGGGGSGFYEVGQIAGAGGDGGSAGEKSPTKTNSTGAAAGSGFGAGGGAGGNGAPYSSGPATVGGDSGGSAADDPDNDPSSTGGGGVGALTINPTNNKITGGNGGSSSSSTNSWYGASFGGGGTGVFIENSSEQTHKGLIITGGNGGSYKGTGNKNPHYNIPAGSTGGGGAGALVNGQLVNLDGSTIIGGKGGSTNTALMGTGGGGDGVAVVGVGSRFENYGTVTGGAGGQNTGNAIYGAGGGAGIRIGHDAYVVNAGTVTAGASYGTGPATSAIMIVGNNATLELRDGSNIMGGITVADGVTGATLAVGGDTTGGTFDGMSGDNGFENFKKTGASTWKVTGNIVANTVKIDQGTLMIENGGGFSVASLTDNGTLAFNQTAALTVSANIAGTGGFSKMGSNTLTLSGNNTFSGNLKVEGGTLLAGSAGAFGTGAGTMDVFSGATVDVGNYNVTVGGLTGGGTVVLGGKGMIVNSVASTTSTFTGNITGSTGSTFEKQGAGTFIMDGALGASTVNVSAGTLQIGTGTATGSMTNANANAVTNNGTLAFNTSNTVTQSGKINGSGKLDMFGTGKLILTADNTYTGQTTIGGGSTLQLGNGGTAGSIDNSTLVNNGTLAFNHSDQLTQSTLLTGTGNLVQQGTGTLILAADNTYTGTTTIATGSTLQLGNGGAAGSITFSSALTDNGTLAVNRTGTVTLQNAINGSGNLNQVNGGTLILTGNNAYAGTTNITGTLQVGNNSTTGKLGAGAVTVASGGILSIDRSNELQLDNVISGAGGFRQEGTGTTILIGANTYSGATTIERGTLQIGDGGATGALGTGAITNKSNLVFNRTGALAVSGAITGSGKVTKMAAGELTLSGANTFTGGLDVQAGSVKAGSSTAFGNGTLTLAAGTTADLNGNDISLKAIDGTGGTVALGAKTLTLTGNDSATFAGTMNGTTNSTFDKKGSGVFTTTGDIGADKVKISEGALQLGNGGTTGWLSAATTIDNSGELIVNRSDDTTLSAAINGDGKLTKQGSNTLILTGNNTYTGGTTVNGGTLSVSGASNLGSASNDLTLNGGTLQATSSFTLDQEIMLGTGGGVIDTKGAGTTLTLSNAVAGESSLVRAANGSLTKIGDGTLNVHDDIVADTFITAGTVRVGDGAKKGDIKGAIDIASGAVLEFDHNNREIDTDTLTGTGLLRVDSPGAYVMRGNSGGFTGTVEANGTLVVDNALGATAVTVTGGTKYGELSGKGSIAGDVTIESGGHLKGIQGQTLSIGGNLTLDAGSVTDISLGDSNAFSSELFNVTGNVTLGGTLNVEDIGGFGPGVYNIIRYGGSQTGTWTLGATGGFNPGLLSITYNGGYVSLDSQLLDPNAYWNGGLANDGGSGTWDAASNNWTDKDGAQNNPYVNNRFAIFNGAPGIVTIDNNAGQVTAGGINFASGNASNGYLINGGDLGLATANDADVPIIRVGDGTANSINIVATIDSNLTGDKGFEKTDLGTLILTHDNDITGNVSIEAGTLQLGDGHGSGSVKGDITVGTGDDYDAHLVINRSDEPVFDQVISGTGTLEQAGTGTTILTGDNAYTGGTFITDGNLQIGNGGTKGKIVGDVDIANGSELIVDLSSDITLDGTISGQGGLTQQGTGTTTLTSDNDYTGQTVISDGELHLKGDGSIEASSGLTNNGTFDISEVNGGTSTIQRLGGDGGVTLGDKTLIIADGKDSDVFSGIIEGNGGLEIGGGTQHLTGDNTYTGGTKIDESGTLVLGDGGKGGSVIGEIVVDGTLIYNHTDPFNVNPISGDGDVKFEGGGAARIDTEQHFTGELEIDQGNTLVVSGDGDISNADGVTVDGTLDVTGINKSDIEIGHLRGGEDGLVDLGDKNIVITNGDGSEFAGVVDGNGGFTVEQGKQILSGENTYTGDTHIGPAGELQLGNDQGKSGKIVSNVVNEGILSGDGTMKDLLNKGEVSPGTDNSFGTLNVDGNYTSEGGRLVLHEELGDDNSKGDRLHISGDTSGTTDVTVINRNGLGAATTNGIEVITVDGQSNGQFNLIGDYVNYRGQQAVVGGAYAYTLEKGSGTDAQGRAAGNDAGNWYLRSQQQGYQPPEPTPDTPTDGNPTSDNPTSDNPTPVNPSNPGTPEYQAGVPLYSAATSALASLNRTGFASFNTRYKAGENAGSNSVGAQGQNGDDLSRSTYFWSRVQGGYDFYTPNGNATGSTYGSHSWSVEAGVDGQFMESDSGSLIGSAWVDYTRSRIDTSSNVGNGRVNVNGYGIGGALTWYGDRGIYLDGQAKATWYTSDMESDIASEEVASGVKSFGYAMSLEAGKEFTFNDRWSVTPQAQLIWSSLNTDDYDDIFNAAVNTPSVRSLTGRLGLAANYATNWQAVDGTASQLTLGGIINVYQELKGGADYIMVSGERVATGSIDKTWGEIGVTANYSWANDTYAVFGKMATASSLQNFGDSYSITGNVGVRVKW